MPDAARPTIGRIVTYREANSTAPDGFIDRAALVIGTADTYDSTCVDVQADLQVYSLSSAYIIRAVPFSEQSTPSAVTWRWPERV